MSRVTSLLLCILVIGLFLNLAKAIKLDYWADFNIYYHSATAAFHQANPYLLKGQFIDGYIYPPSALFLFFPLLLFPLVIAGEIWTGFSIVCLLTSLWLILKIYKTTRKPLIVALVCIFAFNFFPVKYTLGMGQINHVILLLVTLGLYMYNKHHDKRAGTFWGIALAIKYYPLLLLPYLLLQKKWRLVLSISITIILLFSLSLIVMIPETTSRFLFTVFPKISTAWNGDYYNQSLSGLLMRQFNHLAVSELVVARIILSFSLLSISLLVIVKKKTESLVIKNLEISVFIILSLILNSFSWQHHFVLFLLPFFITVLTLKEKRYPTRYYILPLISYLLVGLNLRSPSQVPILFQSHAFFGAFLLWFFNLYLIDKLKKKL